MNSLKDYLFDHGWILRESGGRWQVMDGETIISTGATWSIAALKARVLHPVCCRKLLFHDGKTKME